MKEKYPYRRDQLRNKLLVLTAVVGAFAVSNNINQQEKEVSEGWKIINKAQATYSTDDEPFNNGFRCSYDANEVVYSPSSNSNHQGYVSKDKPFTFHLNNPSKSNIMRAYLPNDERLDSVAIDVEENTVQVRGALDIMYDSPLQPKKTFDLQPTEAITNTSGILSYAVGRSTTGEYFASFWCNQEKTDEIMAEQHSYHVKENVLEVFYPDEFPTYLRVGF